MEEIAQVYARSLFEVADEHDKLDDVRDQLGELADAIGDSKELQTFFFSPYFSTDEKKEGLDKAVSGMDDTLRNFVGLLLENHRVRRAYEVLWEDRNQLLPVQITSAIDLDSSVADRIGKEIGEQTGRKVELTQTTDPDILGGIVLRVGNSILDASIRNRLENLRKQVAKA